LKLSPVRNEAREVKGERKGRGRKRRGHNSKGKEKKDMARQDERGEEAGGRAGRGAERMRRIAYSFFRRAIS